MAISRPQGDNRYRLSLSVAATREFGLVFLNELRRWADTLPLIDPSDLLVVEGLQVTTDGILVDAGGITVTAGGLTVAAGGLTVNGGGITSTANIVQTSAAGAVRIGGWPSDAAYRGVGGANNFLLLEHASNRNIYLISNSGSIYLRQGGVDRLAVHSGGVTVPGLITAADVTVTAMNSSTFATSPVHNNAGDLYYLTSSREAKRNIRPLSRATAAARVNMLRPVTFEPRDNDPVLVKARARASERGKPLAIATEQVGFIVEELHEADPRLVGQDADGNPTAPNLQAICATLVGAVQELSGQVAALSGQVAALTARVAELEGSGGGGDGGGGGRSPGTTLRP